PLVPANPCSGIEDDLAYPVRVMQSQPHGHPTAERLTLDVRPLVALRVEQVDELPGVGRERLRERWLRRKPVPDEVDRHRPVTAAEAHDVLGVGLRMAADSVDEDERRAVAGLDHTGPELFAEVVGLRAEEVEPDRHSTQSSTTVSRMWEG